MMERNSMKLSYVLVLAGTAMLLNSGCAATEKATSAKPHHIDEGQQQEEVIIAPSAFYETCEKLSPGQEAEFSFTVSKPVDFNIHYHTAEGIHYPVQEENIASKSGRLTAEVKSTLLHVDQQPFSPGEPDL